jgi:hypothetical protein
MYVFSIGDHLWEGGLGEVVHKNFDNIARAIGPNAIIVGALQQDFHGEVVQKYLGRNHRDLKNMMPALLVTDTHPSKLTDQSLRVLIPLRDAHEHYKVIDDFLADLAAFVRGDSDQLLKALEAVPKAHDVADAIVKVNIPVVLGVVAVNLNSAVRHLRDWWVRRRRVAARAGAESGSRWKLATGPHTTRRTGPYRAVP